MTKYISNMDIALIVSTFIILICWMLGLPEYLKTLHFGFLIWIGIDIFAILSIKSLLDYYRR